MNGRETRSVCATTPSPMKTPKTFRYTVIGHEPFPLEMLCYNRAWPTTEKSVYAITNSMNMHPRTYKVELESVQTPAVDRWKLFGWSVATKTKPKT